MRNLYTPLSQLNRYSGLFWFGLIAVLVLIFMFPVRTHADIGVYLETGRRIAAGELPYVDYEEINLPTIHYLNAVPIWINQIFQINRVTAFFLLSWGLLLFTCLTIIHIMRRVLTSHDHIGTYIILLVLVIESLLALIILTYGEREYLIVLMFFPYFVLRWHRWNNATIHGLLAFVIGFLYCAGATIKPHFLPMFLIPDLYWIIAKRRLRPLLQPEIYGALTFALIYGVYFGLVAPQIFQAYVNEVVPNVFEGYDASGTVSVPDLIRINMPLIELMIFLILPWIIRPSKENKLWTMARPLTVVTVGALLGFALQRKGWIYQRIPLDVCKLIMIGLYFHFLEDLTLFRRNSFLSRVQSHFLRIRHTLLFAVMIVLLFAAVILMTNSPDLNRRELLEKVVLDHSKPSDLVMVIDTSGNFMYSTLPRLNRGQAARHLYATALAFTYFQRDISDVYEPDHQVPERVQAYLAHTAEDIKKHKPPLIFIHRAKCAACRDGFIIHDYLEARQFIRNFIEPDYDELGDVEDYRVFVRKTDS